MSFTWRGRQFFKLSADYEDHLCDACKEADRQYYKTFADYEDRRCDACKEAYRQYYKSLPGDRRCDACKLAEDACKTEEEGEISGADPTPIDMVKTEEEGKISGADPTPIDPVGIAQRLVMRRRSIAFRVKTIHRIRKF